MAAAGPYVKVVVGGKIGNTDTWSCGVSLAVLSGGTPSAADMNGIAAAAATLFATDVWDHALGWKSFVSPTCDWSKINTYYYPGGSNVATVSGTFALTPDPGTNSTSFIPPQCALVFTLNTGLTGRRNRGRIYMPASPALANTGQVTPATVVNITPLIAKWFTDMNAMSTGAFTFHVCVGTGVLPQIISVTCDTVVDTQRRRRDKQVAAGRTTTAV